MNFFKRIAYHPSVIKITHWEYWSFNAVYSPIYLYFIWLGLKARAIFFVNAANPGILNGGFLMESKKEIYDIIPNQFYPRTVYLPKTAKLSEAISQVQQAGIEYPFIAKPDIGGRGRMVAKINTEAELMEYLDIVQEDYLLQEMVQWKNEAGIFYYRYPNEAKGHISGIVAKEFLSITGNGKSTMLQLLQQEKRFILQIPALHKIYGKRMYEVMPAGITEVLVPFGNHARGSKFIDASNRIDEALTKAIDDICIQIPGFYFGRMDIKFNSWEELKQGKNLSIIELNGSGSEPTHIYDPAHSVFFAWKEIIRHWKIMQRISIINHKTYGVPYMTLKEGLHMLKSDTEHLKKTSNDNSN